MLIWKKKMVKLVVKDVSSVTKRTTAAFSFLILSEPQTENTVTWGLNTYLFRKQRQGWTNYKKGLIVIQ